jgi:hypothetical protein
VATKQDKLRYVGTIHVISQPYLSLTEVTVNDGDNAQLEYGEQATFDMVFKNIGDMASTQAIATLTTRNPLYVTINEGMATIPALAPNETVNLDEVFNITISDELPNGTDLAFGLTMTSENYLWTGSFSFDAHAPNLRVSDIMTVNDETINKGNGNGRLDPGENAQLIFTYINNGGARANDVTATLSTASQQYITISDPVITTATVDTSEIVTLTYNVSVSATMPRGEAALFTLRAETGAYANECDFSHRVGLETINFENGLGDLEWENDPNHPWVVTTTDPYSGQYCLQSGTIGLNATSTLSLPFNVENETDEIRFFRKTDCHTSDYLKFYIDGTEMQQWNGSLNWREMAFPVTQGEHVFTWAYEKDGSNTAGSDHVYIDEILFPVRHIAFSCNAGADQDICQVAAQLEGYVIGGENILWSTLGDGHFSQDNIINPIYTPGDQDLANKSVVLTLTATNVDGEILSDNVAINFHNAASIVMDSEAGVCDGETFEVNALVDETGSVNWTTDGDGSFDHPDNVNTTYTPGEQDKANGQVTLTLNGHSPYGCGDASQSLTLTIYPLQHTEFEMSSCGTYTWNGIEYSEAGDYEQTLQSIHSCDSTVVMHLSMIDVYNIEVEQSACSSYEWAGQTITESGFYEHTFSSIHGCDSIVVMNLTIFDLSQETISLDACDSITWDGITYTESGVYERMYTNVNGCDSIVMLDIAIISAPLIETINGDTEVDVRLTPSSVYTATPSGGDFWSIEPSEAGTIEVDNSVATVTWSNTYKGEAVIKVIAVGYCGQDDNSLTVTVKNSTDVNEFDIEAKLYPNPTDGIINIESQGMQRLTVINALGQTLFDHELEADKAQIEMKQFGVGTYLIRIQTESGLSVRRVSVTR